MRKSSFLQTVAAGVLSGLVVAAIMSRLNAPQTIYPVKGDIYV